MKAIPRAARGIRRAALTLRPLRRGGALAQPAGDTADLKTTFVQRLDGAHTGDDAGDRVANAGDVNRDGREDLIVGAYTADAGGREDAGAAYLVTSSDAQAGQARLGRAGVVEIRGGRKERPHRPDGGRASATSTATGGPTRRSAATA